MNRLCFFILMGLCLATPALAQTRYQISVNDNWRFLRKDTAGAGQTAFLDERWPTVNLPHTWNAADAHDAERGYYTGVGWYRKTMRTPSGTGKTRWFLKFEGANHSASLYVNGRNMGTHNGGYTAFCYEVTEALREPGQTNTIAVKVDNSQTRDIAPISADFTFYGGIYRDVWLVGLNDIHFDICYHSGPGIALTYPKVTEQQATVAASMRFMNETAARQNLVLKMDLRDHRGRTVASTSQKLRLEPGQRMNGHQAQLTLNNPRLWSPDSPYLYQLVTRLEDAKTGQLHDEVQQPAGFRYYHFDAEKGFFLNGKPTKLVGACRHQDYAGLGNALDDERHRQDMVALKRMGGNFIRIAHYPQDPALLEACDRLGILAWEEIPIVNEVQDSPQFFHTSQTQLLDMIWQHRNHPSIILWGYMNEVLLAMKRDKNDPVQQQRTAVRLAKKLDSTARALDPQRYTVMALHNGTAYNESGLADVPQVIGWNLYHGWYHDRFPDFGKMMDAEHVKYPKRPIIISEYGAGGDMRIHSRQPERYDFSSEWMRMYHESYVQQINERPYIAGFSLWNLVDFGSEGRKESMPRINNKGLMTHDRREKDIYHYYRAVYGKEPMVYIASREWPVRKLRSPRALPAYRDSLTFYTNCAKVQVYVNDKMIITKPVKNNIVGYDLPLKRGMNKIVAAGYDEAGTLRVSDELALTVEVERSQLQADTTLPLNTIAVNCGSNAVFVDPINNLTWEADRPYTKGSFGYVGGRYYRKGGRIGVQEEITPERELPVFQTWLDSLQAYKLDVPAGQYELELLFAESDSRNKLIINDIGITPTANPLAKDREFDVVVNGQPLLTHLNLARDYGYNRSVRYKTLVQVTGQDGLEIAFTAHKGNSCLNGLVLRRVY